MPKNEEMERQYSMEKNYEAIARVMQEVRAGKKEYYSTLVAQLEQAADACADSADARACLLELLAEAVSCVSMEIYEKYRRLCELYKQILERALDAGDCSVRLGNVIQKGCALGILPQEKYGQTGRSMLEQEAERSVCAVEELQAQGMAGVRIQLLLKTARSAVIEIADGGIYHTLESYRIYVNGVCVQKSDTVITSLFDLKPQTAYVVSIEGTDSGKTAEVLFTTDYEFVTLDVRDFGAKGDGRSDDTRFIQAAILACPKDGRVLIPRGTYRITSIFLKSDLRLEIAEGAELLAETDRALYPKLPAMLESYDGQEEYNLGTWEGNPLPMFAGIITGIAVENVLLYGKGTINGNASKENWWNNPKVMVGAFRPRLFFLHHCKNVVLQGLKFCNSPSWTLHPYFSEDLQFYGLNVENPKDSPNTDGLDPESCKNVVIAGVRFSLGDDCIAVKSGKIYMGRKHKVPSENIHIRQCLMENGHGAVTVGSEMAGGVKNLVVEECLFSHTDRGLRIKTRRGRGRDAVLDRIIFRKIRMNHVMTPFVVNCFYFCDPDGKTDYVQSREKMPADDGTPCVKRLEFWDIDARNCHVAAAYFDGLPEQKIEEIWMQNVRVTYAKEPKCDVPAMSLGVEACSRRGIFAENIKRLILRNVAICGQDGDAVTLQGVDTLLREEA